MAASRETQHTDEIIKQVLEKCFEDERNIKPKDFAKLLFYDLIKSDCLFYTKVKTLENSYDFHLSKLAHRHLTPLELEQPCFAKLTALAFHLYDNTLLDPNITTIAFKNKNLNNFPPRIYVIGYMAASLSCPRSSNDQLVVVLFVGKPSTSKTKNAEGVTAYAKSICFDSEGVSKYELKDYHVAFYLNDFDYQNIFKRQNLMTIKCIMRGEKCSVKINGSTQQLRPAYVFGCSNSNIFTHVNDKGIITTLPTFTMPKNRHEDLDAIKDRIVEVYFHKRGKVDTKVFDHIITPDVARTALSLLLLRELSKIKNHPLKIASPTFFPAILQGMELCSAEMALVLGKPTSYVETIIQHLKTIYKPLPLLIPSHREKITLLEDSDLVSNFATITQEKTTMQTTSPSLSSS